MDKRYFLIIIIIGVCCINLYMISNVSDVVGSASADAGKYTFTLPNGFSLYEHPRSEAQIFNPDSNITIRIFTTLGKHDNFSTKYEEIDNDNNFKILSNGTINDNGIIIQSLFYQEIENSNNRSTFYFTKDNNNFRILAVGFNYDSQKNETIDIVTQIIDSIRINYKL